VKSINFAALPEALNDSWGEGSRKKRFLENIDTSIVELGQYYSQDFRGSKEENMLIMPRWRNW
jgi:hypothetical protein